MDAATHIAHKSVFLWDFLQGGKGLTEKLIA